MNIAHTKIIVSAATQRDNAQVMSLDLLGNAIMEHNTINFKDSLFNKSFVVNRYALFFKQYVIDVCKKHGLGTGGNTKILPPLILRSHDDIVIRLSPNVVVITHSNGPMLPVIITDNKNAISDHTKSIIRKLYAVDSDVCINRENFESLF